MENINGVDYLKREDIIYWVDKFFVQELAKDRIGRELDEDELMRFTKSLEWGLWDAVFDTTNVAIDLTVEKEN